MTKYPGALLAKPELMTAKVVEVSKSLLSIATTTKNDDEKRDYEEERWCGFGLVILCV